MDRIICLDGPSASGKGSVAQLVAEKLKWHLLPSGTLYRQLALLARRNQLKIEDSKELVQFAGKMAQQPYLYKIADMHDLESEEIGKLASRLSVYPRVREALIPLQRAAYRPPGLVAEGRDMATVIFPDAGLKIYLSASIKIRAQRRMQQLILNNPNNKVKIDTILEQLKERDRRDSARSVAPLRQAKDAVMIDSTTQTLTEVTARVIELAIKKFNLKM